MAKLMASAAVTVMTSSREIRKPPSPSDGASSAAVVGWSLLPVTAHVVIVHPTLSTPSYQRTPRPPPVEGPVGCWVHGVSVMMGLGHRRCCGVPRGLAGLACAVKRWMMAACDTGWALRTLGHCIGAVRWCGQGTSCWIARGRRTWRSYAQCACNAVDTQARCTAQRGVRCLRTTTCLPLCISTTTAVLSFTLDTTTTQQVLLHGTHHNTLHRIAMPPAPAHHAHPSPAP